MKPYKISREKIMRICIKFRPAIIYNLQIILADCP
jgi:hypothetical protein